MRRALPLHIALALCWVACTSLPSVNTTPPRFWPLAVQEVQYESSLDRTPQLALFYRPEAQTEPAPLLVALHSWKANHRGPRLAGAARVAIVRGWVFIHPDFRGPNNRPEALGSPFVVQDILDAVAYARANAQVDESRIYLLGWSGGGHASLLVAGLAPDVWAGVSVWVPITDLAAWHAFQRGSYRSMIESAIGNPETDPQARAEATLRSPLTYLANARGLPVDINAGVWDGHDGAVPISHSLLAFNRLADDADRLTNDEVREFARKPEVPASLRGESEDDPLYATRPILFRRRSGQARITIFEGGHEIVTSAAIDWLSRQARAPELQPATPLPTASTALTSAGAPTAPP